MSVTKVGDLVWVRVQGHPWWPGQVFQAALAVVNCNYFGYRAAQSDQSLTKLFCAVRCRILPCIQVMDPKKTTNDKVKRDRKPDHTLISFFGDDSYGWFPKGRDIIHFHQNYDSKSRQAASKRVDLSLSCLKLICCVTVCNTVPHTTLQLLVV